MNGCKKDFIPRKVTGVLHFVLTTGKCNLRCNYCGGSFPEHAVPFEITYDLAQLERFIEADPAPIVAFYGGEPLLNPKAIARIMDTVKAKFVIQTNGTLVEGLSPEHWRRMDAVLMSIDGTEKTTDAYRGNGIYRRVMKSARALREWGFNGDLIARMAVSERTDIYGDVMHLIGLGMFDHVHWQLDVGWSDAWIDFDGWVEASYKPGIRRLVARFRKGLADGSVLGMVPILGILKRLREGGSSPPCGSGTESFAIMPDGVIRACPISYDAEWAVAGNIKQSTLATLPRKGILGECLECSHLRGCGGRCLYMNRERFWGEEGFRKICALTKYTIDEVSTLIEAVDEAKRGKLVDIELLDYPPFNNSTEIVP